MFSSEEEFESVGDMVGTGGGSWRMFPYSLVPPATVRNYAYYESGKVVGWLWSSLTDFTGFPFYTGRNSASYVLGDISAPLSVGREYEIMFNDFHFVGQKVLDWPAGNSYQAFFDIYLDVYDSTGVLKTHLQMYRSTSFGKQSNPESLANRYVNFVLDASDCESRKFIYEDGDKVCFVVTYEVTGVGASHGIGAAISGKGCNWFQFDEVLVKIVPTPEDEQKGFWAKLLAWMDKLWESIKAIPAAIAAIPSMIIEGLERLFIPDPEHLNSLFDGYKAFAEEHLGFILEIDDLIKTVVEPLTKSGDGADIVLVLPAAQLPAFAESRVLWPDTEFNLSQLLRSTTALNIFYGFYKVFASVLLLGLYLRFLYRVASMILGDGDEEPDVIEVEVVRE